MGRAQGPVRAQEGTQACGQTPFAGHAQAMWLMAAAIQPTK